MVELIDETRAIESTTVGIYRTATVVKGGRRFSWSALVVVGDRQGHVGIGYGKAGGVPMAIEKAQKDAKKRIVPVTLKEGTLPHTVAGKFGASQVKLIPAAPGTGVIAGGTVRAVLEMAGIRDCLTKSYGSTNQKNLCKATMQGLLSLRSKEQVAQLRGVELESSEVEEILASGQRYAPKSKEDSGKGNLADSTDKASAATGEPVESSDAPSVDPEVKIDSCEADETVGDAQASEDSSKQ